jgi:2-polyprenyl-6-methoxyphenol hydroxylase-like FAD-dependent oxidoreductase
VFSNHDTATIYFLEFYSSLKEDIRCTNHQAFRMVAQLNSPKIGIVGAGPVSLTLANILQNNGIPFTLYEASSEFRTQGGSLDLHPQTGQTALKEAGLWDLFKKHARPESDVMKLVELNGEVLWDENTIHKKSISQEERFDGRPEIDRRALINVLTENLNSTSVVFGQKLEEVRPSPDIEGKYNLHFTNGTTETGFDLIVGGDGAWSRVRRLLTDETPTYSGISTLGVSCLDARTNTWLLDYVGEGSLFSFGEGRAIQTQRGDNGSLTSYVSIRVPEDFLDTCGIDWSEPVSARQAYIDKYFGDISVDLKRVVLDSPSELTPRRLFELPVGFRWPFRSGVTLVGDAAHVMTPFAGVGVNVGMTDSLILAREIVAAWRGEKSWDEALRAYETEMFPRAEKNAAKTMKGKVNHFSETGGREFADMLKAMHVHA